MSTNRPVSTSLSGLALTLALGSGVVFAATPLSHVSDRTAPQVYAGPSLRILVAPDAGGAAAKDAVRGLPAGQAAARAALAQMARSGKHQRIEVVLQPGEYVLAKTLEFGPEDSGTADAPVLYMAEKAGTVIVSGAIRMEGRPGKGRNDPTVFASDQIDPAWFAGGGQLYVGGKRAILAREPNVDNYWFVRSAVPQPGEADKDKGGSAFTGTEGSGAFLRGLPPDDRTRAVVQVMQSWTASMHRLQPFTDPDTIHVSPHAIWPFMSKGQNQRFFVQNVAKALDAPGEWIGQGHDVSYIPRPDEAGKPLVAYLPRVDRLIAIHGDAAAKHTVDHLRFKGLKFEHAVYEFPASPYQDNQAASQIGAAVEIDGASDIVFEACGFGHTGGYALWFRQNVRDSSVLRSDFYDLGAGGVRVGLTKQPADDPTPTGNITVAGNHIRDTGLVHPGAVGIWIGQSFDNLVSHNAIARTTYTGISVGWTWGYAAATSGRNKIIGNLLYDIGRGQLADMGAIYTLGISPDTEIANNVIREVRAYEGYGYGAFGLYNDQGSSNINMHDNVVVGTDSGAYYLHFGRDDVLKSNLFAHGRAAEVRVSKPDPTTNLQVADNVIVPDGTQPFDGSFPAESVRFASNRLSSGSAGGKAVAGPCAGNCPDTRIDVAAQSTSVKAIRIAGLSAGDTQRLAKIVADAGPSDGNDSVRALSPMPPQPAPPAVPLTLPIAATAVGQQAVGLRYAPAGDLAAVHVAQLPNAPGGGKCLQFNDSARFAHRSEPSAYAVLNHRTGRTTGSFDIFYDASTQFVQEWRDEGRPFLVGPSMSIDASGVKVGTRVVAKPQPGTWLHVTISANLGSAADGRWTLTLTPQGGSTQTIDNLPLVAPKWAHLSWFGIISNSQTDSSFCLANVSVSNAAK